MRELYIVYFTLIMGLSYNNIYTNHVPNCSYFEAPEGYFYSPQKYSNTIGENLYLSSEIQLKHKHYLTLETNLRKIGFVEEGNSMKINSNEIEPYSHKFSEHYLGFGLGHRYDFYTGYKEKFFIENKVAINKLWSQYYSDMNIFYNMNLGFQYKISKKIDFVSKLQFNTALTTYSTFSNLDEKQFTPYSVGASVGLAYRLEY